MEYPIIDEHGRTWVLDLSTESFKELLNEYGSLHGRPSRAVHKAFVQHNKIDTLRLLVYRGVHGERINLAARALALGPLPSSQWQTPQQSKVPKRKREAFQAAWDQDQIRRNAEILAALNIEAEDFRARGYLD